MSLRTEFTDEQFIADKVQAFINQERTKQNKPILSIDPALAKFAKEHARFNMMNFSALVRSMDNKEDAKQFMRRLNPICTANAGIYTTSTHATKVSELTAQLNADSSFRNIAFDSQQYHIGIGVAASWFPSPESRPATDSSGVLYQTDGNTRRRVQQVAEQAKKSGTTHGAKLAKCKADIEINKRIVQEADAKLITLYSKEKETANVIRGARMGVFFNTKGIPYMVGKIKEKLAELKTLTPKIVDGCDWRLRRRFGNLNIWLGRDREGLVKSEESLENNRQKFADAYIANLDVLKEIFQVGVTKDATLEAITMLEEQKALLEGTEGRRLFGYYDDNIKGYLSMLKNKAYYSQVTILFCENWQ